jgi:hypothetical protein
MSRLNTEASEAMSMLQGQYSIIRCVWKSSLSVSLLPSVLLLPLSLNQRGIIKGLRVTRTLFCQTQRLGLPIGTEGTGA